MKLAFRSHTLLLLAPDAVEARLVETGLFGTAVQRGASQRVPYLEGQDFSQAIGAALAAVPDRPRQVRAVVSDAFCRYYLLQRPQGTARRGELEAAMQARLRKLFGEDPAAWIQLADARPLRREDPVCALPRGLCDSLTAAVGAAGCRLSSLQPYWICCTADQSAARRRGRHWLLGADPHSMSIGLFEDGICRALRSRRRNQESASIATLLLRELALFPEAALLPAEPPATLWAYGDAATLADPLPLGKPGPVHRIGAPAAFGAGAAR